MISTQDNFPWIAKCRVDIKKKCKGIDYKWKTKYCFYSIVVFEKGFMPHEYHSGFY